MFSNTESGVEMVCQNSLIFFITALDEFIKYTERCAVNYGSASGDKDCLVQMQRNM